MGAQCMRSKMTDPNCEECGGEGLIEVQIAVDDFRKECCECSLPDEDEEYDAWRDRQAEYKND